VATGSDSRDGTRVMPPRPEASVPSSGCGLERREWLRGAPGDGQGQSRPPSRYAHCAVRHSRAWNPVPGF